MTTRWARHFREEAEILLATFAGFADPDLPVVGQLLIDRVRIGRFAMEVASGAPNLETLRILGEQLEQHVRREERERFLLIEPSVPENEPLRFAFVLSH